MPDPYGGCAIAYDVMVSNAATRPAPRCRPPKRYRSRAPGRVEFYHQRDIPPRRRGAEKSQIWELVRSLVVGAQSKPRTQRRTLVQNSAPRGCATSKWSAVGPDQSRDREGAVGATRLQFVRFEHAHRLTLFGDDVLHGRRDVLWLPQPSCAAMAPPSRLQPRCTHTS